MSWLQNSVSISELYKHSLTKWSQFSWFTSNWTHSLFSAFTGEVSVLPENHWEVDLHRQRSAGLYLDSVLHIQTGPTLLMFGRTVLIYLLCSQEVNFGMLDCSDGSILNSLETLLAHIMLPALRSQQVRTAVSSVFILSSSRTADHWHVDLKHFVSVRNDLIRYVVWINWIS